MDLREALTEQTEYKVKFRDFLLLFTLRNPTNKEDLEYRRRSNKVQLKNKAVASSDSSLDAPLWLFHKLLTKKEYTNGASPELLEMSDDLLDLVPPRMKIGIVSRHLNDLEGEEEAEIQKN